MAIARGRSMGDINITPLVDVMLVLLVIFMVTVPAVTQVNPLSMPGAAPPTQSTKLVEPVRLHLTAGGIVEWNGEPMSLEQLALRMQTVAAAAGSDAMAQPRLTIAADEAADYQLLTQVLARASNAGLVRIELAGA